MTAKVLSNEFAGTEAAGRERAVAVRDCGVVPARFRVTEEVESVVHDEQFVALWRLRR
jgi:hypothetical protein